MSFMSTNGEDLVTLSEALAFIDSWEERVDDEDVVSSPHVQGMCDAFSLDDIDDLLDVAVKGPVPIWATKSPSPKYNLSSTEIHRASPTRKKNKRVRSAASSSSVLQRRKKMEIATLRQEVKTYEGYLAQINGAAGQRKPLALTTDDERLSEWHRNALVQYRQRHESEQTNQRLKETVKQQIKISTKLRALLFKRNVLHGMEFVRNFESPCYEESLFSVDYSATLMDQLEDEVDSIYRNLNRTLPASMIECASQTTYDEKYASNVMEFATTTPMNWPMGAVWKHVWTSLESGSNRSRKPSTLESKVNVTLPDRNSAAYHFHKLHFLRKFEERDRIVIIWSDILQMTSKKTRLRSVAHAVFTPSRTDPLNACVMQTVLKLYVDPASGEKLSVGEVQHGQEVVLSVFRRLMRKYWQDEQNSLLEISVIKTAELPL